MRSGHLKRPGWHPVGWSPFDGRAAAWANLRWPGMTVRHCGHPTALRPYYIEGDPAGLRAFRTLNEAQLTVESFPPTIPAERPDLELS